MNHDDAIVIPVKGKNPPDLSPVVLMTSSKADLDLLCGLLDIRQDDFSRLHLSRLYLLKSLNYNFSIAGPFIGAPYAAMILEVLIAWGAKKIVCYGWCGAVSDSVKIGDCIIAASAFVDEGTSKHYGQNGSGGNSVSLASVSLVEKLKTGLKKSGISQHEGSVWTTDAIYRETFKKVGYYKEKNVLGVEMELSAIYSVARFRNIEAAGILVVSDEISSLKWKPGFREDRFKKNRAATCEALIRICQTL